MGAAEFATMLKSFLLVLLIGAAGAVHAAPTILVFGDSISAGYGLPRGQSWVDLLQARLEREHADYKVVNASLSGETTDGGRRRLPAALAEHRPQITIIELGGNDGLRGARPETLRANLAAMIAECRKQGSRVLLVGRDLPPNYGSDYTEKFREVFETVARSQRVPLAPFLFEGFATERAMFQPDGIHPVAAAQQRMLDNVWPKLLPLLTPAAAGAKSR